ncbi:YqhA family protein [Alkalimonas collagenimarina]|uniref:YqhA family protein n=1 Tax=Alkalimonas collagenimarina TaxID=400390 RepID=A0ABT9H2Q5_9GAMM|nr:YqhA family protein [Alkalimonas collagenimarina]MDP4537354.1 YqhA family protein [Alkalimonas collagenimarina]
MEKLLQSSRILVLLTIITCATAACLLYASSVVIVYQIVMDTLSQLPTHADEGKRLAVKLLKVLDTLLIALTFQIIASGLYRLFLAKEELKNKGLLKAMDIKNFHDLKITLLQVASVIMVILFLEQAVEVGATIETLYFGIAIAVVILASVFAAKTMSHS